MIKAKKDDIVTVVATKTGMTQKDVKEVYEALFDTIEECILKGYAVPLGKPIVTGKQIGRAHV